MLESPAIPLQKRYVEFDGLRGMLALWVTVAHLLCWCGYGKISGEGKAAKLWYTFTMADAAAEAFIILSGFAITTLLLRESVGYGRYMVRRMFRIYPVYIVVLLLAIWQAPVTGLLLKQVSWSDDFYMDWQRTALQNQDAAWSQHVWAHVFMLHGVIPKQWVNGVSVSFLLPAWSIGLEEQFYLVAPLLLGLLRRSWGLVVVLLVAVAGQLLQDSWHNPVNASLPYWLPYFLVGIGSSYAAAWVEENKEGVVKWGGSIAFAALVSAMFLAKDPLPFLIWGVACPVALGAWRGFASPIGRLIVGLLTNRLARWVGGISYSLYLLHWPLIILLLGAAQVYKPGLSKHEALVLMLTVGLPIILLLSWVLQVVVEKPFMWVGRWLVTKRGSSDALPVIPALP